MTCDCEKCVELAVAIVAEVIMNSDCKVKFQQNLRELLFQAVVYNVDNNFMKPSEAIRASLSAAINCMELFDEFEKEKLNVRAKGSVGTA